MKRLLIMMTMAWATMSAHAITVTDTLFNRNLHEDFAFGADVSFVPQMESWGTKWLDKNGRQKDILQILKEQGINSIRLRVWTVNSGASSKQEVVSLCKRAKAKGMSVMIDFHYSDTWADPGSQTIPAAWKDHSVEALAKNVYDHTYDVLSAIKAAGVVPKWVQVGNGAKWDIIGLSAYPRWSHLDGPTMITRVMSNINDLKKRYGKPCMVVETGHYPREAVVGNQYLVGVMDRMIKNGDLGCFYWEPEPIPSLANLTGISSLQTSDDEVVEVYSLSGKLLRCLPASQLGFSLGDRTSAVVVLPNCVGGTPYIVRKQRLK